MSRPHLANGAFDDPKAEIARLSALLEENGKRFATRHRGCGGEFLSQATRIGRASA